MIRAKLCREGRGFTLELEGHAVYAEPGQDLICAAVSTLAFALESYLDRLDKDSLLIEREKTVLEKGRAKMGALPEAQSADRLHGALELAECFLLLLEENYPENIKFTDKFGRKRRNNHDKQA